MIRPDAFADFKDFGNRYCDPKMSNFARVIEYKGATCTQELHFMLKHSLMIRRLKSEVLSELPPKTRIKISIEIDAKTERWLDREMATLQGQTGKGTGGLPGFLGRASLDENTLYGDGPADDDNKNSGEALAQMMVMYKKTGIAKVEGAINFLTDMMENEVKFLIFAHHLECLDRIEEFINKKDKKYIRIDGSVNPLNRQQAVNKFQSQDDITVAILSLTAASQGITLTKASTVVFLEMHWTPGIMFQAEDRCHRVSQKNNVTCYYLYTESGIDPFLYENIEKKHHSVSSFLDGKSKSLDMIVEKKPEEKKPANGNSDIMSWMVPSDKSSNENISDGQKSNLNFESGEFLPKAVDKKDGGTGPGNQPIAKKDNSLFELDDDLLSELDAVLNDSTNGLNIKKERLSNLKSFPEREM
jgi:SWI/SNF-related matrix-associated actin-dependent regulator 1 of chromatin subfamily A